MEISLSPHGVGSTLGVLFTKFRDPGMVGGGGAVPGGWGRPEGEPADVRAWLQVSAWAGLGQNRARNRKNNHLPSSY